MLIEGYCQNDISFNTLNLINTLIKIQFKNLICKLKIRSLVCQNENNILLKSIYIFCYKFSLAWPNLIVISLPRALCGKTGYFDFTANQAPPSKIWTPWFIYIPLSWGLYSGSHMLPNVVSGDYRVSNMVTPPLW